MPCKASHALVVDGSSQSLYIASHPRSDCTMNFDTKLPVGAFIISAITLSSALIGSHMGDATESHSAANCHIALPSSTDSQDLPLVACGGPSIPSWALTSGRIDLAQFKNKHGGTAGTRTATKNGRTLTLSPDRAGHGGSAYKLSWSRSGGYYSIAPNGHVLRWKSVASMASAHSRERSDVS